jgi:hypothetical protein
MSFWCQVKNEFSFQFDFLSNNQFQTMLFLKSTLIALVVASVAVQEAVGYSKYLKLIPGSTTETGHPDEDTGKLTDLAKAFQSNGEKWDKTLCEKYGADAGLSCDGLEGGGGTPSSGAPSSGAPSSGAPSSGAPSSGAPSSEPPTSGAPSSEPPTPEAPGSKKPDSKHDGKRKKGCKKGSKKSKKGSKKSKKDLLRWR